jgi:hypothetical protein
MTKAEKSLTQLNDASIIEPAAESRHSDWPPLQHLATRHEIPTVKLQRLESKCVCAA